MYDVFICHAREDKETFVRPLAEVLQDTVSVWYDDFALKLGDSLTDCINKGLAESRYGVVVFSQHFFNKNWPQAELNALFAKEMSGTKTILPIWHKINSAEILKFAPLLADRKAAKTEEGMDYVVEQILNVVKPDELHCTRNHQTLSLVPSSIRLHGGEWEVKTPITVTNLSKVPVHNVRIKFLLNPPGLRSESVKIKPVGNTSQFQENVGNYTLFTDFVTIYLVNPNNRNSLILQIYYLEAGGSRVFQAWGTEPIESMADLSICGFSSKPGEMFSKAGRTVIPFKTS